MAIVHHIWTEYFIACDNKRILKIHYNPSRRFVCRESFLKLLLSKITHLRLTTAPHNKICSQKVRAQSGVQLKGRCKRIWLSGKQNNNEKKKQKSRSEEQGKRPAIFEIIEHSPVDTNLNGAEEECDVRCEMRKMNNDCLWMNKINFADKNLKSHIYRLAHTQPCSDRCRLWWWWCCWWCVSICFFLLLIHSPPTLRRLNFQYSWYFKRLKIGSFLFRLRSFFDFDASYGIDIIIIIIPVETSTKKRFST